MVEKKWIITINLEKVRFLLRKTVFYHSIENDKLKKEIQKNKKEIQKLKEFKSSVLYTREHEIIPLKEEVEHYKSIAMVTRKSLASYEDGLIEAGFFRVDGVWGIKGEKNNDKTKTLKVWTGK